MHYYAHLFLNLKYKAIATVFETLAYNSTIHVVGLVKRFRRAGSNEGSSGGIMGSFRSANSISLLMEDLFIVPMW